MSDDLQRWRSLPILHELFLQWRSARATVAPRVRPFSRDWERLLQDAGLTSADLRREADRDARTLADAGLVELRTVRLRPYQIERIIIPLLAEPRVRTIFADELLEAGEPEVDFASFPWNPALQFMREARTAVPFADLQLLNEYFQRTPGTCDSVPIKERSLEIFGDEKRLDALLLTTLFRPDRLTLEHFQCHLIHEPLAWKRGRHSAGPVIVLENAATWDSYCRWDAKAQRFSAVVYGCGNRFRDSISFLSEIFREISGPRPVLYFGDLDPQGVRIPLQALLLARRLHLPAIEPDLWSYEHLLTRGRPQPCDSVDPLPVEDLSWFGPLSAPVHELFDSKHRLAQEAVGWDFLRLCE